MKPKKLAFKAKDSVKLYAANVKIPVLALRPRREMRTGTAQFANFKKYGIQTYVSENGVHGSSMLVRVSSETLLDLMLF